MTYKWIDPEPGTKMTDGVRFLPENASIFVFGRPMPDLLYREEP